VKFLFVLNEEFFQRGVGVIHPVALGGDKQQDRGKRDFILLKGAFARFCDNGIARDSCFGENAKVNKRTAGQV
jgi:hypothetical protein